MQPDWVKTYLGDEIALLYGRALPKSDRTEGKYPVFGSNGIVGYHNEALVKGPGIIIGRKGSCGAVHFSTSDFWPIDTTYYIALRKDHDWRFMDFFLSTFGLNEMNSHSTIPGLNRENVYKLKCHIPRFPEQQKIAAVLFKVQKAIEIQDSIIEKTLELKKSILHHVFTHGLRGEKTKETEIGRIPESWEVVPIEKAYGFTKKPKHIVYADYDSLAFIPMDLIPKNSPHLEKFINKKPSEISSGTYFEEGDILIAKITPCFENGKQCIVTGCPNGFGIATTEVIPIKEKAGLSDKYFLFYYLLKSNIRALIAGKMEGATGRQRVPNHLIKELLIPLPSLDEQKEISKVFLTIDQKTELHTAKKSALQDLFKTMLNKLMTGEIRVGDLEVDVAEVASAG